MRALALALACGLLLAACGSSGPAGDEDNAAAVNQTSEPPAARSSCFEPTSQEKFALRSAVRQHGRKVSDEPWARVHDHGEYFMAARLAGSESPPLVLLVSFPEQGLYVADMKALDGPAEAYTDLPVAAGAIPPAGRRAIACLKRG